MTRPQLVVFVKAPVIGGAKTRLAKGIGKVQAWRRHRAMTSTLLHRLQDKRWDVVICLSPDRALERQFPGVWPQHLSRRLQGGGDLGDRQGRVFSERAPVCVIGSDAPQITRGDIAAAFEGLKRADAVIGPAEDGGYWLLALNGPTPVGLFDGMRWSHEETRADLIGQLKRYGLDRIIQLRRLRDVDEVSDLRCA